jgi:hypothetical protein
MRRITRAPAPTTAAWPSSTAETAAARAKYDPLFEYLCRADEGPVEMSFDEIGRLVGGLRIGGALASLVGE